MNLHELRAFTLVALLGGLSFWPAALSTPPAEALAHQPESTRALDMPRASGGARAVPPSGGDLRLHTEGKAHQKRAGLTGENRTPLFLASETRPASAPVYVAHSQGVRLASERETWVVHLSPPNVVAEKPAPGYSRSLALGAFVSAAEGPSTRLQAASGTRIPMTSGQYDRAKRQAKSLSTDPKMIAGPSDRERGVTGRRDGQQAFEGGAAWKDTAVPAGTPRNQAGAGIESGHHLRALATNAANLCGVPPALFHALIERESSWRPHVVSRSGAVGLAQVKPSTARGVSPGLDVREPWQNLVAGACYLRQQFDRFGTWREALHAYRVGPNARPSKVARDYAADIIQGSAQ